MCFTPKLVESLVNQLKNHSVYYKIKKVFPLPFILYRVACHQKVLLMAHKKCIDKATCLVPTLLSDILHSRRIDIVTYLQLKTLERWTPVISARFVYLHIP